LPGDGASGFAGWCPSFFLVFSDETNGIISSPVTPSSNFLKKKSSYPPADQETGRLTITLYLDKADFRAALDMTDEEHIYVLVVDRQGHEFFRARGPYNREAEAALRQILGQL
jgi:hypothetical protein